MKRRMTSTGKRRRRRARALPLVALAAAALGGAGFAAAGALGGGTANPDVTQGLAELGADAWYATHSHHVNAKVVARVDAAQRRRCATVSYRRTHQSSCPNLRIYGPKRRSALRQEFSNPNPGTNGQWSVVYPANGQPSQTPAIGVHAVLLPTGKVLLLGPTLRGDNQSAAFLWDPQNPGTFKEVDPPRDPATGKSYNFWCGGQTLLPNGTVLFAGGNLRWQDPSNPVAGTFWAGLDRMATFDPWTETWTDQGPMTGDEGGGNHAGRWYPTVTPLPDGRALIYGGWDDTGTNHYNTAIGLFTPNPTNPEAKGTYQSIPSDLGTPSRPLGSPGLYPRLFVMANGDTVMVGPREGDYRVLNTSNPDTSKWTWSANKAGSNTGAFVAGKFSRRYWGADVLMPFSASTGPTTVMRVGGADGTNQANDTTTPIINLSNLTAGEQAGPSLNVARAHLNTVVLPDGEVLTVGGGLGSSSVTAGDGSTGLYAGPQFQSELWSPSTNVWSLADTQSKPRTYHSIALLLPDGSVLSGGDDRNGPGTRLDDTLEVYKPPYLFQGARPTLAGVPATADYGTALNVQTSGGTKAVLIANGAVTHAFDNDQRSIALSSSPTPGGLSVVIPTNPAIAPPGYYMLFVVNAQGVPSAGAFIHVGPPIATTPPSGGGSPAATGGNPVVVAAPAGSPVGTGARVGAVKTDRVKPSLSRLVIKRFQGRYRVTFRLSERASVSALLTRKKGTTGGLTAKSLKRSLRARTFKAGAVRLSLGALRPGGYRLTLTLRDVAGNRSAVASSFRVK